MTGFHHCSRPINSAAELADAIRAAVAVGSHGTAMLLAELLKGNMAVLPCGVSTSNARLKQFFAMTSGRPAVLLAGFDDGADARPEDWPAARRARDWARWTMVHGAGFERTHYQLAIDVAHLNQRVLIVECSGATLPAWETFMRSGPRPAVGLAVRPHGQHPVAEKVEALH